MPKRRRNRGEGTITARANGTWMGQVTTGWCPETRTQTRKTVYGATAREVREKLTALLTREPVAGGDQTFDTFFRFWRNSVRGSLAASTLAVHDRLAGYLSRYVGKRHLADLTALHVVQMYERMARDGLSDDARHKAGEQLRKSLKVAQNAGWVRANVAAQVPLPRVRRKEIRPLHPEEVPRFLHACSGRRLEALPVVALDSGARLGELLALEWSDWNPATREISITKSLKLLGDAGRHTVGTTKTAGSRRKVQLSAHTAGVLEAHRAKMAAEGHQAAPAFCTRNGKYQWHKNVQKHLLAHVLVEAELPPMRFHDLRHSSATLLLLAGLDIKTIAARLGHSNPRQLLQTYAHVLPAMHGRAASVMDDFLTGAAPPHGGGPAPALKIAEVL